MGVAEVGDGRLGFADAVVGFGTMVELDASIEGLPTVDKSKGDRL